MIEWIMIHNTHCKKNLLYYHHPQPTNKAQNTQIYKLKYILINNIIYDSIVILFMPRLNPNRFIVAAPGSVDQTVLAVTECYHTIFFDKIICV